MGISLFLTFIFLHIAFGLALAFFVLHYAAKTEHKMLKNFGFVVGYLLIILAVVSMILGTVFAVKKPHYGHCPYMHENMKHEEMMEHGMPMMQEQKEEIQEQKPEDKNEKKISDKHQIRKEGKGCPVKTKKEIEKELKDGKRTGAACRADMKEDKPLQKQGK
jgi:hypothetical protein